MGPLSTRRVLGLVACICLVLLVIVLGTPEGESDVWIELAEYSNSVASLRVSNRGNTTVRVDPHCTLHWTNQAKLFTNSFFRHQANYVVLQPGKLVLVAVPSPPAAKTW